MCDRRSEIAAESMNSRCVSLPSCKKDGVIRSVPGLMCSRSLPGKQGLSVCRHAHAVRKRVHRLTLVLLCHRGAHAVDLVARGSSRPA